MQLRPTPTPTGAPAPTPAAKPMQIGTYDEGLLDLADKVTIDKKQTFKTREEAIAFAQKNPGAELVVEQRSGAGGLGYDVYGVTINDKGQTLANAGKMENLKLFDKPLAKIEKETGHVTQRAFFVTEDGKPGANIYNPKFDRTTYDKLREHLGLSDSKQWYKLVDKYMTAPSPADKIPAIEKKELDNLTSKLKPGDIIMTGNNGSFIHGIVFVGQDKELQTKLEQKWHLAPGTLDKEHMIIHSLAADHAAEMELDGQKFTQPPGGTGVIIDTIERYTGRNPRDVMIAVEVKGATEADRKAVIAEGKKMLGRGYDNGFNTFDDRDIYCTEFVYKSWMAAPDSDPGFTTQLHPLVPGTSVPFTGSFYSKLNPEAKKFLDDDGMLYQEMIMTDGIMTSPNVNIKWASQNADQSEFVQKHQRWADGIAGKISPGYQKLIREHVPTEAARSSDIIDKIKALAQETRKELSQPAQAAPAAPAAPAPKPVTPPKPHGHVD